MIQQFLLLENYLKMRASKFTPTDRYALIYSYSPPGVYLDHFRNT